MLSGNQKKRDTEKITEIITKKPELINCTAKKPPKQDDGQSPLQVAFKTRNFWAVKYFLEKGADVNFMDAESINDWKMPVLHDGIMAVVSLARFEVPTDPWDKEKKDAFEIKGTKEHFDKGLALLNCMVEKGADVNSLDSYGNTALMRLCADIKNRWFDKERPLAKESVEDLKQIFDLLIKYGADINQSTPTREPITKMQRNLLEQMGIL